MNEPIRPSGPRIPSDSVNLAGLDPVERRIIHLLQRDGRMSTAEMAREIGVTEATARRKLNRLLDDRVIAVRAVAEPHDLGYGVTAVMGLDVAHDRIEAVAEALAAYDFVDSVSVVTGPYHILVQLALGSTAELYDFIMREIAAIEGVRDTHTFMTMKVFKHHGLRGLPGEGAAPPTRRAGHVRKTRPKGRRDK
ncbi:MAG: Lrp/AsnC family transcriptional regulator [Alphaproteobacteria bacterium]|nr:Lrp/AsnC family transcriptional regulator [Alphaproteobacteria bacterium]